MKETHRNPKVSLLILTVVLFGILSVFIGCRDIHVPIALDPTVCTPDSDSPTEHSIPVKLKAGDNLLLVKVRQHGDYWGMAVRMIADVTTTIPKR